MHVFFARGKFLGKIRMAIYQRVDAEQLWKEVPRDQQLMNALIRSPNYEPGISS